NFTFTTQATATGGAKIAHYVYDFGDGTSQQTTSATISHTYTRVGTFNTKVTVFVTVNGSTVAAAAAADCAKQVVVKPVPVTPVFACNALSARLIGKAEDRNFAFSLAFTAEGGAVLNNVDLNFGDGTTLKGINPSDLSSSGNINHSFAAEGTFTTTATLHFNVSSQVKDVNCTTVINASPNVCATNPSLPANSPECAPCTIPGKEQFPKNSPECVEAPPAVTPAPTALPSTGPTDMINGAMGIGSVSGAGFYWLRSRRDMINKILGR
ncbi:MAG: PKD domain-containing protein, partial [Microcoleus sp.]